MTSSISFLSKWVLFFTMGLFFFASCGSKKGVVKRDPSPRTENFLIAILPIENLSGTVVPLKEIRQGLAHHLQKQGIKVLEEESLGRLMARYRVRYTGGMNGAVAQAIRKETGAEAVLITTVELFDEALYPKVALTSRLVSTEEVPVILWMDGVGMAGDDSPGVLGLGLIEDSQLLLQKAMEYLSNSLIAFLSGREGALSDTKKERRFQPKVFYRSPEISEGKDYSIAVVPFLNESGRKNAGEILVLHFVRELTKLKGFRVIELGMLRQRLLNARIIMTEGISLTDADLIANDLEADLVINGKVMDYQDPSGSWGLTKVDFFITAIEQRSRKIVWTSSSYNQGDDGVYLFDWGKINTAHGMTSRMVRSIGQTLGRPERSERFNVPEVYENPRDSF